MNEIEMTVKLVNAFSRFEIELADFGRWFEFVNGLKTELEIIASNIDDLIDNVGIDSLLEDFANDITPRAIVGDFEKDLFDALFTN